MTQIETMEKLNEGIALLETQRKLAEKAGKIFKELGIDICGKPSTIEKCYSKAANKTLMLYTGISQLAEALGIGMYHPKFNEYSEPHEDRIAFVFGDYEIFEITEGKDEKTV